VAEVHVVGLKDGSAVERDCGEGVETFEDQVCKGRGCGGGFWRDGEFKAVEPGFCGDPLDGEFVGVDEGVRNSLRRLH
jgi:hypothetical protein